MPSEGELNAMKIWGMRSEALGVEIPLKLKNGFRGILFTVDVTDHPGDQYQDGAGDEYLAL